MSLIPFWNWPVKCPFPLRPAMIPTAWIQLAAMLQKASDAWNPWGFQRPGIYRELIHIIITVKMQLKIDISHQAP